MLKYAIAACMLWYTIIYTILWLDLFFPLINHHIWPHPIKVAMNSFTSYGLGFLTTGVILVYVTVLAKHRASIYSPKVKAALQIVVSLFFFYIP